MSSCYWSASAHCKWCKGCYQQPSGINYFFILQNSFLLEPEAAIINFCSSLFCLIIDLPESYFDFKCLQWTIQVFHVVRFSCIVLFGCVGEFCKHALEVLDFLKVCHIANTPFAVYVCFKCSYTSFSIYWCIIFPIYIHNRYVILVSDWFLRG